MPIITLEVMPETVPYDNYYPDAHQNNGSDEEMKDQSRVAFHIDKHEDTGMHFLVDKNEPTEHDHNGEGTEPSASVRADLLEYTVRSDGSVCCKICGKVLATRTHWYRHKYRAHAPHPVNPAPLFQCEQCLIYFKSRKGYIGHIASKHSETLQDASPVLTNAQAEALAKEKSKIQPEPETVGGPAPTRSHPDTQVKKEPDPEQVIPKTVVATYQSVAVKAITKSSEAPHRKTTRSSRPDQANVEKDKRSREEKLVADIIARVRRECEAQGIGAARRGYSRKSALPT